MDTEAAERWRPVLRAIVEHQGIEEAIEAILRLLDTPRPQSSEVAPPRLRPARDASTNAQGTFRIPAIPATSAAKDNTEEPDDLAHQESLSPLDYFTVEQASAYVGVNKHSVYHVLTNYPERLPHKREKNGTGLPRFMILGRALNEWRLERERRGKKRLDNTENKDEEPNDGDSTETAHA